MQAASRPGVVDADPPKLSVDAVSTRRGRMRLSGSADDNLAVRDVRWRAEAGRSGVARMTWKIDSGDHRTGARGHMAWTASLPLRAGRNTIVVRAVDVKGNVTTRVLTRRVSRARAAHLRTDGR